MKKISINEDIEILFKFKSKCSDVLFQFIVEYEDKYLQMKAEVMELLQTIMDKYPFEYSTIYGIFKVSFSYLRIIIFESSFH